MSLTTCDRDLEDQEITPSSVRSTFTEEITDVFQDIEARKELSSVLIAQYGSGPNHDAASWRLRKKHQASINERLSSLGMLPALACGNLLSTFSGTAVIQPERLSRWRDTLRNSPVFARCNLVQTGQLFGAKNSNWSRIEEAIRNLGNCMTLAVDNLDDVVILKAFDSLKTHIVKHAFASDRTTDLWIEYLKWLGKATQFVFLNEPVEIPEHCVYDMEGDILPYKGELAFISDSIKNYTRRTSPLSYHAARKLVQLAQLPRGTPYPSRDQITASVKKTVEVFTSEFKPSYRALEGHRKGLARTLRRCPKRPTRTHVSLNTSGRLESSRSTGGGAPLLIGATRAYTDQPITDSISDIVGKFDQFGEYLVDPATWFVAQQLLAREPYTIVPTLGDILFVKPDEIKDLWGNVLFPNSKRVPTKLAKLLNLSASLMITEVGHYEPTFEMHHNVMCFQSRNVKFKLDVTSLRVNADVSIEKGLKARITTSAMTAFSHLSQLPANYMREYLSQDQFLKTGFEEPDKLWQVLKVYKARKGQ